MSPNETQLVLAATSVVGLTIGVYLTLTIAGVVATARGAMSRDYARTRAGQVPPDWLGNIGRNFVNLIEVPVLFYVLVAFHLAGGFAVDATQMALGWAFAASRFAHSLVHMTSNTLGLRFLIHRAGVVILAVMWVKFALQLIG